MLQFGLWGENVTSRWNGGVATIEECPDGEVWGVVWKMANEDIASLDKYDKLFFQLSPVYFHTHPIYMYIYRCVYTCITAI